MDDRVDDSPEGQELLLSQLAEDFQFEVEKLWVAISSVRFQIEGGGDFSSSNQDLAKEAADVQSELEDLREATTNVLGSLRISLGKRQELTENDVAVARSNSLLRLEEEEAEAEDSLVESLGLQLQESHMLLQALEGRVLRILERQDNPQQGSRTGTLPKSLLWSHALSFRKSDDGVPMQSAAPEPMPSMQIASHADEGQSLGLAVKPSACYSNSPNMEAWAPSTTAHSGLSPQSHQMLQDLEGLMEPEVDEEAPEASHAAGLANTAFASTLAVPTTSLNQSLQQFPLPEEFLSDHAPVLRTGTMGMTHLLARMKSLLREQNAWQGHDDEDKQASEATQAAQVLEALPEEPEEESPPAGGGDCLGLCST
ncbi:hypothetical protein WJX84_007647, partial [Apatococcus fuscideae]